MSLHAPRLSRLGAAFTQALLAIALVGCATPPMCESSGEYLEDAVITARIKATLLVHRPQSAMRVNVETFKRRVQLSGFVDSRMERFLASSAAASVPGVCEVINDIQLR